MASPSPAHPSPWPLPRPPTQDGNCFKSATARLFNAIMSTSLTQVRPPCLPFHGHPGSSTAPRSPRYACLEKALFTDVQAPQPCLEKAHPSPSSSPHSLTPLPHPHTTPPGLSLPPPPGGGDVSRRDGGDRLRVGVSQPPKASRRQPGRQRKPRHRRAAARVRRCYLAPYIAPV